MAEDAVHASATFSPIWVEDVARCFTHSISEAQTIGQSVGALARYFGNSTEFWSNLQSAYELDVARQELVEKLEKEIEPVAA